MKIAELKRMLRAFGCYELTTNAKGHDIWYSPLSKATFRVPRHQSKEVPTGTLRIIMKAAGIE